MRKFAQIHVAMVLGLCDPDRTETELNEFFGRTIELPNPAPPTDASGYVTNWEEFKSYVDATWAGLKERAEE